MRSQFRCKVIMHKMADLDVVFLRLSQGTVVELTAQNPQNGRHLLNEVNDPERETPMFKLKYD